jgi:hypothetical protein
MLSNWVFVRKCESQTAEELGTVKTIAYKDALTGVKSACQLICEIFKHSPVFRTGGDEFVVIINGQDYPNRDELVDSFNQQVEKNLKEGKVVIYGGI